MDQPHKFQIGMFMAPPGNGPAWHTHDYVEIFMPLSGKWRFYWGTDPDKPDEPEGEEIFGGARRHFLSPLDSGAASRMLGKRTPGALPFWNPTKSL